MAPIRVGIIGLAATSNVSMTGSWGVTSHLRSILALSKEYDIVAVANSSVESAQRSIDFHKLPSTTKAYGNPEDIAADPNVDLVVVSVEVTKHAFLVKPAIAHKKALFVEWPLGANVAQAEELTKLAAANSIKTMVGLQSRSGSLVRKLSEVLASGKVGQVTSSNVTICQSMLPKNLSPLPKGTEFILDFKGGANVFTVFFGHFLDSFTYLLGDFAEVQGLLKSEHANVPIIDPTNGQVVNPAYPKTVPDHIIVQGILENGAIASIALRTTSSPADAIGFRWYITGTEGEILVTTGEEAWTSSVSSRRSIKLTTSKGAKVEDIDFTPSETSRADTVAPPGTNTARQYESFARGDEVVTFEAALKTHRLLERIAKSAGWEL